MKRFATAIMLAALVPLAGCTGAGGRSDGAWAYYDASYAGGMEGYDDVPVPYYAGAPAGQPYADPDYYSAQPAPTQPPAYCGYSSQSYQGDGYSSHAHEGDYSQSNHGRGFSVQSYQSGCYYGQPPYPTNGAYGSPEQSGGYYSPPAQSQPNPGNGAYGPPDQGGSYYNQPTPYDHYDVRPDHGGAYYNRPHADLGHDTPPPRHDGDHVRHKAYHESQDIAPPPPSPAHDAVKHDRSWYSTQYSFGN
ncbi:MAG TPA: hypothetical protein VHZ32_18920 [Rhizomicrobium sp.]|nr:hypothetical protein [Rhizomicrobium sp.]